LVHYIADESFSVFVSTTKSVAVANSFATRNLDVKKDHYAYCYAVKCDGGYELPPKPGPEDKTSPQIPKGVTKDLKAENEITISGPIFPENIVGYRKIICEREGPFFLGPVYLTCCMTVSFLV
jgi:hypothetical protein